MSDTAPICIHRQRGAALFMALSFLLIMTLLGVFSMNLSRLENLMAGNSQFQALALNHAELMLDAGLREVEDAIGPPYIDPQDRGDHIYLLMTGAEELIDPAVPVWEFNSVSTTPPGGNPDYSYYYVIEYLGPVGGTANGKCTASTGTGNELDDCRREIYRVTSQSTTRRGARRILQSVFVAWDRM